MGSTPSDAPGRADAGGQEGGAGAMRPDGSRNVPGLAAELAGADCHAVVIGTGRHPAGSALPALPSATRSARALAEVLSTTCGMGDRVDLLIDPAAPARS